MVYGPPGEMIKLVILNILMLVAGFAALVKGADMFVEGSASLARRFHVPGLIIGLTIVAMGTSMPELAVSTAAALQGSNEIALSNVVGSNLFNLLIVLGLCAVLHPVPTDQAVLRRDYPVNLVTTVAVLAFVGGLPLLSGKLPGLKMADTAGLVGRPLAALLIAGFIAYLAVLVISARRNPTPEEEHPEPFSPGRCAFQLILGLALIVAGGEAVVVSAKAIARAAGMSETLIGLTVVALGTSLPELATSLVAAHKGETGMAVGNVVGSNLMNLMFVLGISAMIHPIGVNLASVIDMVILTVVSLVCYLFLYTRRRLDRWEGALMVALYVADVVFAIAR